MATNKSVPAEQDAPTDEDLDAEQGRGAPQDQSPLAAEPKRPAKKAKQKRTRTVREYEERVPEPEHPRDDHPHDGGGDADGATYDESPLAAMADAQLAMTHVSRVGPGTGPGWVGGMNFDWGDGRGPQPVSKGPVGTYQKTGDLFSVVIGEAGGGRFRFVTKGQPPVEETLPGPPLPLPMENQGQPQPQRGAYGPDPRHDERDDRGYDQRPADPVEGMDPDVGVAPEELAQSSLNGWYQNGRTGYWQFFANGQPVRPPRGSRPPVAAPGFGGAVGIAPGMYDHSGDDRLSRLEQLVQKMADGGGKSDYEKIERLFAEKKGNDALASMMANQITMANNAAIQAQAARDHEFRMLQERVKVEEADRKAKAAVDATAATEIKKLELEAIKTKAEADKEVAKENAKTAQANSTAMLASQERIAKIQADANAQVLQAMTGASDKRDPVELLTRGMEIAAAAAGGKSAAAEITTAVAGAAERMIPAVADAVVAIKTQNAQGGGGGGGSPADDDMVGRVVGLIAMLHSKGTPPIEVPKFIGSACFVSGFDATKLDPFITIGTPAAISAYLEMAASKATDEVNRKKMLDAKEVLSSESGKKWFAEVRQAFLAARGKGAAPPPPPPQISGNGPANLGPGRN